MKKPRAKIVYRNVTHLINNKQTIPGFDEPESQSSPIASELAPTPQHQERDPLHFIPIWFVWLVFAITATAIVTYLFIRPGSP